MLQSHIFYEKTTNYLPERLHAPPLIFLILARCHCCLRFVGLKGLCDGHMSVRSYMGCLRLVDSLKSLVSFAKESYNRDDILQR